VRDDVRHAGGTREIDIDMDRVVVARCAGVEGQCRASDGRQRERRELVANADRIGETMSAAADDGVARSSATRAMLIGHIGQLDDKRPRAALLWNTFAIRE
jgi:hypothetical protein